MGYQKAMLKVWCPACGKRIELEVRLYENGAFSIVQHFTSRISVKHSSEGHNHG